MPIKEAWLAKRQEEIVEPGLPIIDPHHHLGVFHGFRYMLEDFLADVQSGHNIRATVFVECRAMHRADGPEHLKPIGETEFMNGIAAQSASGLYGETRVAAGIVSFADLTLGGAVDEVLEAHIAAAPGRFRGIRHLTAIDDDPRIQVSYTHPTKGLMADRTFRQGLSRLGAYGLSFDAWIYHHQIMELVDLARACPDITIILDHAGGVLGTGPYAGRRSEIFAQWMTDMVTLSECPNVVVKLGGLNMDMSGFGWQERLVPPSSDEIAAATRDYYLHAIDAFGTDRCMFESNFHVDKFSLSYQVLWNAFKKVANEAGLGPSEKADLFHDTAKRVYRLS